MARAIPTHTLPEDTVREALEFISEGLRPADLAEVRATIGTTEDPFWAIFESWEGSTAAWLIVDDTGLPIGIFGVSPHVIPKVGIAWMLGRSEIEDNAHSVARQTRRYVAEMNDLYPALWANVDARNELSMDWLTWAGFTITDANPNFGPEGRLFIEFIRTPKNVSSSSHPDPRGPRRGGNGGRGDRRDPISERRQLSPQRAV